MGNERRVKKLSPDDEWLQHVTTEVAKSLHTWLRATVNTKRAIADLKKEELLALAGNLIVTYEYERSRRPQVQRPYDVPDPLQFLV